ncbi:MAG: phospholipid/cholesterol/gamma-HCH transport system ATP-binding protein [Candidatus Pelagisphaera sp.]|jgi:phospholipid/cholesterol/gamma-HCH transport system ATP-binding protein
MSDAFLQIRGLSKRFGNQVILDGIDLDIPLKSHTTVIGKSGTGKSVFLKCISKLLDPDSGTISLSNSSAAVPQCAYMFQQNALFDSLNVFDNVALPLREKHRISQKELSARVNDLLNKLDLTDAASKYPAEISGGMQKRVALARALITSPEIILFDEPTTGLDPERKFAVFDMIRNYRERFGFTVIMVSHDVPEIFGISDQVAWLDSGTIKFWGSPASLLDSPPSDLKGFLNPKLSTETSAV